VISGTNRAGPLSMEPMIGVASEYASNPFLNSSQARAQNNQALLFDDPTRYDLDSLHIAIDPSIRYGDSGSYASLASNYFHLSGSTILLSDLDTLTLKAGLGRDSSLYQYGLASDGVGVRSDSNSASLDWQHTLTERGSIALDGGWSRVLYSQGAAATGLVDYRYYSAGATASYALTERNTLQLTVNAGQYSALDNLTSSRNFALRLGFDRKLTEIWSLSTSLGYAKSNNSEKIYSGPVFVGSVEYGPYYLETVHASQRGPVFNAGVTRTGETVTFKAYASRAFLPSGFAFLSRQDIADIEANYLRSDRLSFGAVLSYQTTATPAPNASLYSTHYFSGQLSAAWHWTPNWLITLNTRWIKVRYDLPPVEAQSTGVSLQISRQFYRIDL